MFASDTWRETAVVIAAVLGILAAISSQLMYVYGRRAEQPKYFGGAPIKQDVSEKSLRAEGARERAALRTSFCQSAATAFVVATALLGLYVGLPNSLTAGVAIIAIFIGVGLPLTKALLLWRADRGIVASTEFYVMVQGGAKSFPVEEQRRMFARDHPNLAHWL